MADDFDPNAGLFGGDEPETNPEEEHLKFIFGLNPNRTSAISDLFSNEMMATINEIKNNVTNIIVSIMQSIKALQTLRFFFITFSFQLTMP